jgi:cellulose synthase/poly-beta-1,6-N-acetylglucosamine synthase-like glycosyltransferase
MLIQRKVLGSVAYLGGLGFTYEQFTWSLLQLAQYNNLYVCGSQERIHYMRSRVSYHAKARNELAKNMLGDWILMLDADHAPEPDLLARMLRVFYKYHLDVLVGWYQIKVWPYGPLLYVWNDDHTGFELIGKWEDRGAEVMEIGAAGGGALLIRRTVLYRILTELDELPFDIQPPFSEDLSFFARCYKLGIKAYFCPNIMNPHLYIDTLKPEYIETTGIAQNQMEVEGLKIL